MKEPIRVAQMMTEMNFGGVEMVVMNYYRHIDRTKVQFDFFVLDGSLVPQKAEIEALGGRIYEVPKYTHLIRYEKAIIKQFKENKYFIVHSHMNTLSVFSLFGAWIAGVPNRISHNHSTASKGDVKKNIVKAILRPFVKVFATELCACSKLAGDWMYGLDTKYHIFNNAIDLKLFKYDEKKRVAIRRSLGIENKYVIGHIGRFCYQKNQDLLIDIFYELIQSYNDAVLLLIGEGELEQKIRHKVKLLKIDDRVIFLGKRDDVYRYYQAMDVFVLPSRYEGLPVVGVEAQASGLPCVFSASITDEVKMANNVAFIRINDDLKDWINCIVGCKNSRISSIKNLRDAGYDIKTESKKLSYYYQDLLLQGIDNI